VAAQSRLLGERHGGDLPQQCTARRAEDSNGNYTQVFNLVTTPSVTDDYDLYNLTMTYDLSSVRILSTTIYITQDKNQRT